MPSQTTLKKIVLGAVLLGGLFLAASFVKTLRSDPVVFKETGKSAHFEKDFFEAKFPGPVSLKSTSSVSKSGSIRTGFRNYYSAAPGLGDVSVLVIEYGAALPEDLTPDKFFELFVRGNLTAYQNHEVLRMERTAVQGHPAMRVELSFDDKARASQVRFFMESRILLASRTRVYNLTVTYPESGAVRIGPVLREFFESFKFTGEIPNAIAEAPGLDASMTPV